MQVIAPRWTKLDNDHGWKTTKYGIRKLKDFSLRRVCGASMIKRVKRRRQKIAIEAFAVLNALFFMTARVREMTI